MDKTIITIIHLYQSINVKSLSITINVKSLFLSSLKPDFFFSKVTVVETRPIMFLKINIEIGKCNS